jgi:hypothetical protein
MTGRNFWAMKSGESWIVREEGLPGQASTHATPQEAWAEARTRAEVMGGEAFLTADDGELCKREWFGAQPRDIKI